MNFIELIPDDYPCTGYIYNEQGKYENGVRLENLEALGKFFEEQVFPAYQKKLEIRITDRWDFMIFHSKNGVIIWPPQINKPNYG